MKDLFGDQPYQLPQPRPSKAFDGETYVVKRDHARLKGQLLKVFSVMRDSRWRTLAEIAADVSGSEAAVSARLRDFRKEKYGAHAVLRESIGNGLFRYRLVVNVAEGEKTSIVPNKPTGGSNGTTIERLRQVEEAERQAAEKIG